MKHIFKFSLFFTTLFSLHATLVFAQGPTNFSTPKANRANSLSNSFSNQAPIVEVNGIAVVVNDEVITRQELQERMQMIEQRLKAQGVALPPAAELKKQVIERLIIDRVQLQLARDTGLRVDDVMLDRAIARIAEQNKMTTQVLRDQVEKDGTSYAQFREGVREDIMLQNVLEREVNSKVQVSESEVDSYLLAQKAQKQKGQEVELSQILIRIPDNATPEEVEKIQARADIVMQQINAGGDFSQLAAAHSDSAEALQGGSLGWREEDRYPQLFIEAIDRLNVGESTGLIKSANGFHILKLLGRRNADNSVQQAEGIPQAHVRHILIKISQTETKDQAKNKLVQLKQRVEQGGDRFDDLAKHYSNDDSASKGGDLGWLQPGDVPEFELAINALKDGQVSEPIETPYGMHLIQLVGRKVEEVSAERQRKLARQAIRVRKVDEATSDWVRELRDRAYVEIRGDDNRI